MLRIRDFEESQLRVSAATGKQTMKHLSKIFSILLLVLFFGASFSAQAQEYIVDRIDDTLATGCSAFTLNDCSLRGAIQNANTDGADSKIQLLIPAQSVQTIGLNTALPSIANNGTLIITSDSIIVGGSTGRVAVSGNTSVRLFSISPGANVTFRNVAIQNGGFSTPNDGAAIDNNQGTVTIDNCLFLNNISTDDAGAVKNTGSATMTINNTDFQSNSAAARGGAIFNEGTLTITGSLFRGNSANTDGGAISNRGTLTVSNSTFSGNSAKRYSGAIDAEAGTINLNSVTIANNVADSDNSGDGNGGGISVNNVGFPIVNAVNTIIAKNTANSGTAPDFQNTLISQGFNLIGNTAGTIITGTTTGNQLNVDPLILPLRANGGPTLTHALSPTSPAIDKGATNTSLDQRGLPRTFDFPGISNTSGGTDIGAFERRPNDTVFYDFDGDRKTDVSVFRPGNGVWYLQQSTNGFTGVSFGTNGDLIAPADFDGDGKTDIAVFRPSNGVWYLQRSSQGFTGVVFGASGDVPMPGDFDGDGKADLSVFRPSNGTWYIQQSTGGFVGVVFGTNGDIPVANDYDGDGRADVAVFRPSNGTWYLNRSQAGFVGVVFGTSGDKPNAADFDGDGKADIAVFRPSNGTWYLQQSTAGFNGVLFGTNGDAPVAGDYDGDGKADVSVFRPSNGTWYLNRSTQGFTGIVFGTNGDKPAPNAFVP